VGTSKTILAAGSLSNDTPRLVGRFAGEGGEVALGPMTTFGRSPENSLQIGDRELSKQHFSIEKVGNSFLIRDLNSSNGTFINGRKISELRLREGDEISFGTSRVVFHGGGPRRHEAAVFVPTHQALSQPAEKASERSLLADLLIRGFVKEKNPQVLMEKAVRAAQQLVGSDWAAVYLVTRSGPVVRRAESRREPSLGPPANDVEVANRVRASGNRLRSEDQGVGTLLGVPLVRAEATLGVLLAGCVERTSAFDDECAQALYRLSSEAAARLPPVAELEFWG
jgi:pSer/pThr/pTyr-binding forkhead associated (FHA) protein